MDHIMPWHLLLQASRILCVLFVQLCLVFVVNIYVSVRWPPWWILLSFWSPSKPGIERVQALADFRVRRYVVIATKPVHRLQIRPIMHNYRAPPSIPQLTSGSVQSCGNAAKDRQTHRHTHKTQTTVWPLYISPPLRLTQNITSGQSNLTYKTASLPQTDGSIVFARWRQWRIRWTCASFGPPESTTRTTNWSVQPFVVHSSLYNGWPFPQNCPFSWGSGFWTPSNSWSLGPFWSQNPNGITIGSALFAQVTAECSYTLQWVPLSPKNCLFPWEIWTPSNTWFLGPIRTHNRNGVSIGSPVLHRWPQIVPILWNWTPLYPSKLPLPMEESRPSSNTCFPGQPESSTQMASRSVQPFLQDSLVWETDWQTTLLGR